MEHLHPRRWDELARRADVQADIAALRAWTAERFERVDANIEGAKQEVLATVHGEMNRLITTQTRTIVFALVAALTANTGLVLTVVRLG